MKAVVRIAHAGVRRTGVAATVALLLFASIGCESGPSGPGSWDAAVENATMSFGAAVIEVQGPGIVGFEPAGTTQVYWAETTQVDNYRVVLISPEGSSSVPFRVRVSDLGGPVPGGTVVEVADLLNNPVAVLSTFSVRVDTP